MVDNSQEWVPFLDAPWSHDQKEAFLHIHAWHDALKAMKLPGNDAAENKRLLGEEAGLIEKGETGALLPAKLSEKTFELAEKNALPLEWFSSQVRAAHYFHGPVRFATGTDLKQFLQEAIAPKGYLIARLADVAHRWQLPQVSDLATAFFLVQQLIDLKKAVANNRIFIPMADLDQAGISIEDLKEGVKNSAMEKLMWKQVIRIRDAFAQGQPLVKEVPRKYRRTFKRNWLKGLEFVLEIERRGYDLWSAPIALSKIQQFQISVLALVSKGAARARL